MMKLVSLYYSFLLFLFSCSLEETLQASKIDEFETLDDMSAHDLSSTSVCSRPSTNGSKYKTSTTRLAVVHRDSPCAEEGTKRQVALTLAEILGKDQLRVQSIQAAAAANTNSKETKIPARSGDSLGTGDYVVTIGLGTPTHKLTLVFDTGSDLSWTQCRPCYKNDCYPQHEPMFRPSNSSTYSKILCSSPHCVEIGDHKRGRKGCSKGNPHCPFIVKYDGGGYTTGFYATDKLTLASSRGDMFYNFRFGCSNFNTGHSWEVAGILGLGRDPTSLVSQTAYKYNKTFSYCLPEIGSIGFLSFGQEEHNHNKPGIMMFTPFVGSLSFSHYHISITDIIVGRTRLDIPEIVFHTAGAIIDSGTVLTYLPPLAYEVMRTDFKWLMNEVFGHASAPAHDDLLDTCFYITEHDRVPRVSIVFKNGAKIRLARSATVYEITSTMACLAFAGNKRDKELAIFGNFQQVQLEVMYDVPGNRLGLRVNPDCV